MKETNRRLEDKLKIQIENTLDMLMRKNYLYDYDKLKQQRIDAETIRLSWNNHISGGFNSGNSFLKILQYQQILKNHSYLCVLMDGSLIRVSYTIKNDKLIAHNLLWWPAPFKYEGITANDISPEEMLEYFLEDEEWSERIEMRSPIRFDYDPRESVVCDKHHPVHMHIQHKDCRIFVDKPICFNKFINYIFLNFYPEYEIYIDRNDFIDFNLQYENNNVLNYLSEFI